MTSVPQASDHGLSTFNDSESQTQASDDGNTSTVTRRPKRIALPNDKVFALAASHEWAELENIWQMGRQRVHNRILYAVRAIAKREGKDLDVVRAELNVLRAANGLQVRYAKGRKAPSGRPKKLMAMGQAVVEASTGQMDHSYRPCRQI